MLCQKQTFLIFYTQHFSFNKKVEYRKEKENHVKNRDVIRTDIHIQRQKRGIKNRKTKENEVKKHDVKKKIYSF